MHKIAICQSIKDKCMITALTHEIFLLSCCAEEPLDTGFSRRNLSRLRWKPEQTKLSASSRVPARALQSDAALRAALIPRPRCSGRGLRRPETRHFHSQTHNEHFLPRLSSDACFWIITLSRTAPCKSFYL